VRPGSIVCGDRVAIRSSGDSGQVTEDVFKGGAAVLRDCCCSRVVGQSIGAKNIRRGQERGSES